MLSEFSREDHMILKPSNINQDTITGGIDIVAMENSEDQTIPN
jgi:hypothetical protein